MKKQLFLLFILGCASIEIKAQTFSDDNFVTTSSPQKAVQSANYTSLTKSEVIQNVTYFDGLGRPIQSIALRQGGNILNPQDIVTHIEYDAFGRQSKEYLPYAFTNAGNEHLKTGSQGATNSFYNTSKYENTTNPFSEKRFEASPLNRVLEQAAPGNPWALANSHTIKMDYQTNITDEVKLFAANTSWNATKGQYDSTLGQTTSYAPNQLYKTITKDENWTLTDGNNKTTEEFKDKEGRVVLKRTYNAGQKYDTYYVYDIYGNLTYVLPPKTEASTTSIATIISQLDDLAYQYIYDARNRLVEKKLPGKGWEYIVYDKLDRPILTQDAVLKLTNKWLFTKYDAFGRVVYTGDYVNTTATNRVDVQTLANAVTTLFETKLATSSPINGTTVYYSNNAFPNINTTSINLYTINYYDDYTFDKDLSVLPSLIYDRAVVNYDNNANKSLTKGLATGSKVRVLGTTNWITTLTGYDIKGRPIYNYTKNDYLAFTNTLKSKIDFTGRTLETTSTHLKNSVNTIVVDVFSYDQSGRLTKQTQAINGAATPEVIAENEYDELGQLFQKKVGGKTSQSRLQTVDYTYNIRGWLKGINDTNTIGNDLFSFKINYNNPSTGTALFNGNISQTFWKTANSDSSLKSYTYTYDALNRLTNATDSSALNSGRYNESLSYDKNGNITSLFRLGDTNSGATTFGTMDNLTYTYDAGNKLQIVSDSAHDTNGFKDDLIGSSPDTTTDYTYDINGNMKTDTNKGITNIVYNHLNLPTQVVLVGGSINYVYDATGAKQRKIVSTGITTDYAGGFQYEGTTLKFFSHPEGYVAYNSGTFDYIYQYKDHLGNVRLSYGDRNNNGSIVVSSDPNITEIIEEDNYYPFGLKHKGYNSNPIYAKGNATGQKYKYNGKEWQDDNIGGVQLNWYDYGWRDYDPAIGRWTTMDPLLNDLKFSFDDSKVDEDDEDEVYQALVTKLETAEGIYNTNNLNPYGYGYNDPVSFDDPDGRCPWCIVILAVYLLTPETAVAPTGNWKEDGKAVGESKAMKGNVLLSVAGAGLATKIASSSKSTPAKEKAVEKTTEKSSEKKVPNPDGKNGGKAHQKTIDKQEAKMKKEGFSETRREVKVETPKGEKSKRYIDLEGKNPKTGEVKQVQVGKQNKNGTPVARERRAIDDIHQASGKKPEFVPYN